jgi:hypothetical protein
MIPAVPTIPDTVFPCWFCQEPCQPPLCKNKECLKYFVNYSFLENLGDSLMFRTQFKVNINFREYVINYLPSIKTMEVYEKILSPGMKSYLEISYFLQMIFSTPYESLTITPQNAPYKLPALIALS